MTLITNNSSLSTLLNAPLPLTALSTHYSALSTHNSALTRQTII
ncbi:hypothetical protein [Nostoc sp. CMAA1605]|nr:hypothetical protein [Nostoc sp. CMAA1605]